VSVQRPLVAVLAAAALGALAAPATAAGIKPPPTLRVGATEYKFTLGKSTIVPGPRSIVLVNSGTVKHDLVLRRLNASGSPVGAALSLPRVAAGKQAKRTFALVAGRCSLVCTIEDHAAKGMTARLTVRKPR
jgi:hypothetical protein